MNQLREAEPAMSDDQFLAWAERREGRYELVEGRVMMQAGATRDHERVAKRIFMALAAQIDETIFDVNKGDFGVRIRPGRGRGTILYPDVIVDAQSAQGEERTTETPVVVVEVLSRTTDFDHHVEKLKLYSRRETLRQYVVFEQTSPKAYVWFASENGWNQTPEVIDGLRGIVSFPSVAAELRLSEIYRPVRLQEPTGLPP